MVRHGLRALRAVIAAGVLAATPAVARTHTLPTTHVPDIVARHLVPAAGKPGPDTRLDLDIALPQRNGEALDALLGQITDPASPQYRHYLSVAQFTARFGPTASDYAKTEDFLRAQGFAITATGANRTMVSVNARVADIERAFHLKLNLYKHPSENRNFIAPDREPTVDLSVRLLHVVGLDDFELPVPRFVQGKEDGASRHSTGSGPKGFFLGSDMRAAYYGGSALTGAGQSLGLMELKGYIPSDIPFYFNTVGQPLNVAVNGISVDGTPVDCGTCNDVEQALDIEYAISMAPGLSQVQVYVARSPEAVLNAMASDGSSMQLSTSWGWHKQFETDDALFKEMAAQGQSFLTASGDDSTLKASGQWPEEDANLTAVGGTDLVTNGGGGPWLAEPGWKDSAGGPSLDRNILIESYQLPFIDTKNDGSTTLRNVPDIGANANTDFYVCAEGKCFGHIGGTSFASPIWTGFLALANEQAASHGNPPVGFLNPTLYALAMQKKEYKTILHDAIGNKSGIYRTVKGYDLVTGLGSPNGQQLIDALAP